MASDTIVALATPPGISGLAVIRISGPKTFAVLNRLSKNKRFDQVPSHTIHLTWIVDEKKMPIDQVMVAVFKKPNSYTGEDMGEISCHGSPVIIDRIIEHCLKQGCRMAEPGEFTRRAVLSGKLTLSQAEAILGLVNARTLDGHRVAIEAYQGKTTRFFTDIANKLREIYAEAEYLLGFDEEDSSTNPLIKKTKSLLNLVNRAIVSAERTRFLFEPARVAIVGKSNVGKSSLFNRLLQQERAITSPYPGTTRDRITAELILRNITIQLTDTCGFAPRAKDPLTRLGTEHTRKAIEESDMVLMVFDGSQPWQKEDEEVVALVNKKPKIYIVNKTDLPQRLKLNSFLRNERPILISCKTGKGINRLSRKMVSLLAPNNTFSPVFNIRHIEILKECRDALKKSLLAPDLETYNAELQLGLEALAKVDGGITTEEILDRIFSRFCIGK